MGNNNGRRHATGSGSHSDNRRQVYILYNGSDATQRNNARMFRDALRAGEGGKNFNITHFVNVNNEQFDRISWIKKIQSVLVLCVDENGAESLRSVIDTGEIKANAMHRVLSVSFGTIRPQRIMGSILERPEGLDQKDFCFGFQNLDELTTNDFDSSPVMRELKTSMMSA